jgi:hypothetical protein
MRPRLPREEIWVMWMDLTAGPPPLAPQMVTLADYGQNPSGGGDRTSWRATSWIGLSRIVQTPQWEQYQTLCTGWFWFALGFAACNEIALPGLPVLYSQRAAGGFGHLVRVIIHVLEKTVAPVVASSSVMHSIA